MEKFQVQVNVTTRSAVSRDRMRYHLVSSRRACSIALIHISACNALVFRLEEKRNKSST